MGPVKHELADADLEKLRRTLLQVISLLVNGEFGALSDLARRSELGPDEMARIVAGYPHRLAMPPNELLQTLLNPNDDMWRAEPADPEEYWVDLKLWGEDSRSLRLRVLVGLMEAPGEIYDVSIADIGDELAQLDREKFRRTLPRLTELLATGQYEALVRLSRRKEVTPQYLAECVALYPRPRPHGACRRRCSLRAGGVLPSAEVWRSGPAWA